MIRVFLNRVLLRFYSNIKTICNILLLWFCKLPQDEDEKMSFFALGKSNGTQ